MADQKRFERIAGSLDSAPDLEHVFLVDCTAADVGLAGDPRIHAFSELTGSPTADFVDEDIAEDDPAVIFYTSGTTGRPKGAISTHRSMIANLQNTMYNAVAGSMAGGGALPDAGGGANVALFTSPLFHVSGCHSTLVVGPAGRPQAGDARGSLHARDGTPADPGSPGDRVGDRAHHGVAGVRAPRPPRLRHDVGEERRLRRIAVGRRAPAHDPGDLPQRVDAPPTPTGSPRHHRSPPSSPGRTPSSGPTRWVRPCRPCT